MRIRGIALIILVVVLVTPAVSASIPDAHFCMEIWTPSDPVGGGIGYTDIKSSGNYTVTDEAGLIAALANATSGQTVFIDGSTTIDRTDDAPLTIPAGVTVASDRGNGASTGALIKKKNWTANYGWENPIFIIGGNNVRITGLTLEGEMLEVSDSAQFSEDWYLVGILAQSKDNLEVDNCEVRGFAWAGIYSENSGDDSVNVSVHHSYLHHNQAYGEGYGIQLDNGTLEADYNIFDYNRHDIAAGAGTSRYFARFNRIEGHGTAIGSSHFDHHGIEDWMYIQSNTLNMVDVYNSSYFVGIQDSTADSTLYASNNTVYWDSAWSDKPIFIHGSLATAPGVINNYMGTPTPALYPNETGMVMY